MPLKIEIHKAGDLDPDKSVMLIEDVETLRKEQEIECVELCKKAYDLGLWRANKGE